MTDRHIQARRALNGTLAGQGIAAFGLLIQWVAAPEVFPGFPPGLFFIIGASAIVWFDRRATWSPVAAVALALWIIAGGLSGGELVRNFVSGDIGLIVGNLVMVAGLLASAVAGIVTIVHNRRSDLPGWPKPLSAHNPRRVAVIVTIAGLMADAIGDAAPEGLAWDGPGPAMFAALALLVAIVPGRTMPALATVLSAAFVVATFTNAEPLATLANPAEPIGFGFLLLQLAGLITAVIGGIMTLLPARTPAEPARVEA